MAQVLHRRNSVLAGLVAVALAPLLSVAAPAAATPPRGAPALATAVPELHWAACGGKAVGYQCATATVPLDHDDPGGATTQLALAKWPAPDPSRRTGTVFVNPGGPGGSGVSLVTGGFGQALGQSLQGRFDVVGPDPRGVGASDPLRCFDSEQDLEEFVAGAPVFPYRSDQFLPFFRHYRALAQECRDDEDDRRIADHMSTADVARDLDLLRQAVGDERLTYLGFSYGSYLGNTYANLFPERVRALVIDGVLDPRLWAGGAHIALDRTSTLEVFREFLRLCDEADDECAFRTEAGSTARWRALADALRREATTLPTDEGPVPYTYDRLIADANGAMYAPEVWDGPDGFAAFLDGLADAVLAGREPGATVGSARAALLDQLAPQPEPEADYPNGFDAYFGNHCADAQYPRSFATWLGVHAYAAAGSRWGPLSWWGQAACADWPVAADRYTGPWTARTAAPVLVVGNYFDNATDYAGAVASSRLLPNSRLLSYAGWGHTAYGRSACVTSAVDAYLLDGTLPPAGTVCPANPNPFLPSGDRQLAGERPLTGLPPTIGPARNAR